MSIDDLVNSEEGTGRREEKAPDIDYNTYTNTTPLNIMLTDAELAPLPSSIYGMHIPETGKSYVNDGLRGNVMQRYRTEIHELLHKVMQTGSEYVVRTLEAFISGVKQIRSRYDLKPEYVF